MDAQHYLVCTVRRNEEGRLEAQLDGFVQNCDLPAAQQYFARKKHRESRSHTTTSTADSLRLFKLVAVEQ